MHNNCTKYTFYKSVLDQFMKYIISHIYNLVINTIKKGIKILIPSLT